MKKIILILGVALASLSASAQTDTVGTDRAVLALDSSSVNLCSNGLDSCWMWQGQRVLETEDFRGCSQNNAYLCSLDIEGIDKNSPKDSVITYFLSTLATKPCTERDRKYVIIED